MADVARRAGVSTATVSRALRDMPGVSPGTRLRVKQIADELAYVISPEASRLSRGATGRIAVVVPKIQLWFYATMLASIEAVLSDAEMDVLIYQVDGEEQRNRFFQQLPARRKVDAVVLTALPLLQDEAQRLDLMGVHVVVAGGRIRDYPHVQVDDQEIARSAVRHLVDLGHQRIAMIRTSDTERTYWSSDAERTRGYKAALVEAGIEPDPDCLVTESFGAGAGADGAQRLMELDRPPTAIFAYSDEIAISALSSLRRMGVRVPDDVSVVGVDGHPLAEVFDLTTVVQSVELQGHLAGRMVLDLLRGHTVPETEVVVPSRLVVRGSTGRAPVLSRLPAGS